MQRELVAGKRTQPGQNCLGFIADWLQGSVVWYFSQSQSATVRYQNTVKPFTVDLSFFTVDATNESRERHKITRFRLAKQQLCTCIVHFWYISLPSLHADVIMPNLTFCGGRKHKATTFVRPLGTSPPVVSCCRRRRCLSSLFRGETSGGVLKCRLFSILYYYRRNFCNLIGLERWYFSLIWNTYMWKLQTLCG